MDNPKVHILLPVHNRREITLRFIECLKRQTYTNHHLILIDDGSTDGTADAVKASLEGVTVIRGDGTWWWAGSLQQGNNWLKRNGIPKEDYVLVMNDDTDFDEGFIMIGVNIIRWHTKTILTATGYNLKTGQPQDSGGYKFVWENLECIETYDCSEMNCLSTRGMLLRVSDFLNIGGFYPRLIPHYLSDLEFTMRAYRKGMKLMTHKGFKIYINFETTGHRELKDESLPQFLRKMFSKRAAMNPVYWTNFILLRAPWKYKIRNVSNVWKSVLNQTVRQRLLARWRRKP